MGQITFRRITPEESRILDAEGDHVGDVYAHDDILRPGKRVYLILLESDPRGLGEGLRPRPHPRGRRGAPREPSVLSVGTAARSGSPVR